MSDDGRKNSSAEAGKDDPPVSPTTPGSPRNSSTADATGNEGLRPQEEGQRAPSIRSRRSRRSRGIPSLAPRTTLAQRTQGNFTLAGPDDTPMLRKAQETFVHPGYADLNPSYDQPANPKPVWSLAKPLPRVVRSGMVPTRDELIADRQKAQRPAEYSNRMGLDVDPNDLENGQIGKDADPRKIAAQVEDARRQRENKFLNSVLSGDAASRRPGSRMSRASIRRRNSAWAPSADRLSTVQEGEPQDNQGRQNYKDDDPLQPIPEAEDSDEEDEPIEDELGLPPVTDATLPEDLHPLVQDLVEDEVHNNHTTWSVIRTHHREALAEALGAYVQLTIGFSVDLSVTIANAGNPNTTDWCWGLATMIGIYISGGVSGAHLNPTITMMLWFYRGFPKSKMPEYFFAQFMGAFCAAFTAYGIYYDSIQNYLINNSNIGIITSFVTNQRETWITKETAFFNEFIGTCLLGITILALGDDQNAPPGAGMNSLIVGLVITCLSMGFAYQTGAAFNPSRDFGPRLALLALGYGSDLFLNPYWFYGPWAGSLCGAFIGAFLYDFFIFTGGESPVNYPIERTQRAFKKSCMKWERRLHLVKREVDNTIE